MTLPLVPCCHLPKWRKVCQALLGKGSHQEPGSGEQHTGGSLQAEGMGQELDSHPALSPKLRPEMFQVMEPFLQSVWRQLPLPPGSQANPSLPGKLQAAASYGTGKLSQPCHSLPSPAQLPAAGGLGGHSQACCSSQPGSIRTPIPSIWRAVVLLESLLGSRDGLPGPHSSSLGLLSHFSA